jgi:hypothetical protein
VERTKNGVRRKKNLIQMLKKNVPYRCMRNGPWK